MENCGLRINDIVWVWVCNQQPDPGIIVHLPVDGEKDDDGSTNPTNHKLTVVLVGGKLYAINRHRLWRTKLEATTVGPPIFLPEGMCEDTVKW
jgi:hypothetical protein